MFIHELVGTEENEHYRTLEVQNLIRQYDFTRSIHQAALALGHIGLSEEQLRALNYHAIACLHRHAGEYRPHNVVITNSFHKPPPFEAVPELVEGLVGDLAGLWNRFDALNLAAFVLWRLNWIHPFVNGNGRTARVAAYYTLCIKLGLWLPGNVVMPELIRADREPYYAALRDADRSFEEGQLNLDSLAHYLRGLLVEQLQSGQTL